MSILTASINKVIAFVISLLLTVFPNSTFLEVRYQEYSFPGVEAICEEMSKAIKNNDIEAIEALFCQADRQDPDKDLPGQIQNFIDSIEGDIISIGWQPGIGSQSDYADKGVYSSRRLFGMRVETTQAVYFVYIAWVVVDSEIPEDVGMSSMMLVDAEYQEVVQVN